jgi:outer membrane protein TolC
VEQSARLRTAFAQYYLAARSEGITRELLDLVARIEQIAQARYAGGLAPQQDAIRAQLEQTAIRSELIGVANERRQLQARINVLLGRAPATPLAEPAALPALPATADLSAETLLARASATNPIVRAEGARLESARASRELTLRNRYPDFNVGVVPTQVGSRITSWGVMVEVNIPLQQSVRRSQESEAAAMLDAARARTEAAANQVAADLQEQLSALQAARSNEALISARQLPQADLVVQSATASYQIGKVDFATLLEAQRQARKARIDLLKAQVDAQVRVAEIERILGEPL